MAHSNSTATGTAFRQVQCMRQWSFMVVIGKYSAFGSGLLWSWSASTVHAAVVSNGRDRQLQCIRQWSLMVVIGKYSACGSGL